MENQGCLASQVIGIEFVSVRLVYSLVDRFVAVSHDSVFIL